MKRIDEIWMVLAENEKDGEEGSEGIVSGRVGLRWLPLMISAGNEQRVAALGAAAQETANESGKTLRVVKFTRAEVVGTITPEPRVVIKCPACGTESDARTCITPDPGVSSGRTVDISLCIKCRCICKYTDDHTALILMTDDEIAELPEATRAILSRARAELRRLSE